MRKETRWELSLRCECGFVVTGSEEEALLAAARGHASEVHHVHVGTELLRPLVERKAPRTERPSSTAGHIGKWEEES